jgi:hypothetical protein
MTRFFYFSISYWYQSADLEMDARRMWRHEWFSLIITTEEPKAMDLSFFSFPKDDQLRKAWIHYCRRWNFNPTSGHKLCSCQWLLWKGSFENDGTWCWWNLQATTRNYNTCILCMKFKQDYNMLNLMYIYAPWSSDRGKLRKRGEHDDLLLNHDLHSNIINYYRFSPLVFAHV